MLDDLNDGENNGSTDGGALRKQLEDALKAKTALEKQNADLSKQVRSSSIEKLFADAKADVRGLKFYSGDPTKEALTEWLKGDGDVFATAPAAGSEQTSTEQTSNEQVVLPPGFTPEMMAAAQAASKMVPPATPAPTGDLEALTSQLDGLNYTSTDDEAKVDAALKAIQAQAVAMIANGGSF